MRDLAQIRVPGLSVSGGLALPGPGPLVTGPPPGASTPPRPALPSPLRPLPQANERGALLARSTRPQLPEWSRGQPGAEQGFLAGKKVYTLYINMPNLTSGAGSWILRFVELEDRQPAGHTSAGRPGGPGRSSAGSEEIDLAAPVALRKVDPGYVAGAIRDKVEGLVVLHAVIRKDGRVERIEVMRSLDPRLDERAVQALQRWEFQPATRNGTPVDLEAVVQIPFALPRAF